MTKTVARTAAGTPAGGQFAAQAHTDPDLALTPGASDWPDDRIAVLVDDIAAAGAEYATPDRRRSIASSVAIGRAAPERAAEYGALIATSNNWRHGDTPEKTAAHIHEHTPWHADRIAGLSDDIAGHIEASSADLLDDGATAAAWRRYAAALRNPTTQ